MYTGIGGQLNELSFAISLMPYGRLPSRHQLSSICRTLGKYIVDEDKQGSVANFKRKKA